MFQPKLIKSQVLIFILILLVCCKPNDKTENAAQIVDQATIATHIAKLASDDFMGRMPFTEGEEKTTNYLKTEFEKLGLSPGNGDSYFQEVPMVEITGTPSEKMKISGPTGNFDLNYFDDFVALTVKSRENVGPSGYGPVAPV